MGGGRGSRWRKPDVGGWGEGDAGDGRGRKSRVTSRVRGRRKPRWYKVGEFDNAKGIAHVGGRKRGVELWSGAVLYIKHSKGCFYFGAIQCIL